MTMFDYENGITDRAIDIERDYKNKPVRKDINAESENGSPLWGALFGAILFGAKGAEIEGFGGAIVLSIIGAIIGAIMGVFGLDIFGAHIGGGDGDDEGDGGGEF